MSNKQFLGHLAGLRGLAIIFVVLFHLNGQFWAHGYLGVDVFLVITGYLLFRARTMHTGRENWKDFFKFLSKRFCRIVPPMAIIILISMLVGAFFLWYSDEQNLCKAGTDACLGMANVFFGKILGDYFAADAAFIPLLHLWYLSVTLQVYLIYAVANQVLQWIPRRWVIALLAVVGVVSMGFCYSLPIHNALEKLGVPVWVQTEEISYYSMFPRLWEVLAGGLILLLPSCKQKRGVATVLTVLSLAMLVAIALIPWFKGVVPCTLLVVLSTILIIRYAPEGKWSWLLDNKLFKWLGGISFSLYLVHMPIIVFAHMWMFGQASVGNELLILIACVLSGWGFWWCIEKRRMPLWLALILWAGTIVACEIGIKKNGFKFSFPRLETPIYDKWQLCKNERLHNPWSSHLNPTFAVWQLMNQKFDRNKPEIFLALGDNSQQATFVLIGDSHGAHSFPGMDQMSHRAGISGVYLSTIIYPFHDCIYSLNKEYTYTPDKEEALFEWLTQHPELTHVIIAQKWNSSIRRISPQKAEIKLRQFLQRIKDIGKQVVLIGPGPEFDMRKPMSYFKIGLLREKAASYYCTLEQLHSRHTIVYPILQKMVDEGLCTLIDQADALAPGERFEALQENTVMMRDDNHYYAPLSIHIMERLRPQFEAALKKQ